MPDGRAPCAGGRQHRSRPDARSGLLGGNIDSARQGLQLLSVKIGEVLLVLGALHFANLAVFARFRGRAHEQDLLAHQGHGLE